MRIFTVAFLVTDIGIIVMAAVWLRKTTEKTKYKIFENRDAIIKVTILLQGGCFLWMLFPQLT